MDINDDEFSLDEEQAVSTPKASKSMKSLYEELAKRTTKEEGGIKVKRERVEKRTKEEKVPEKQGKTITKKRGDESCKYIKNRTLEGQLKEKALSGVLRILNMISKTQAERNVE